MSDYAIDPELEPLLAIDMDGGLEDPVKAREGMAKMMSKLAAELDESGVRCSDFSITAEAGHDIPLRLYQSENEPQPAAILLIHGGGFVAGNLDTEHGMGVELCRHLGITCLSVDYRLAPEHPYPAALDDCFDAFKWLCHNAADLGVDVDRIAVMGQSAGGGLAAALTLRCYSDGAELPAKPCYQFLGIPELDDRLETDSMRRFVDTPMWSRPQAELSWAHYLGDALTPGADDVPVFAAPARASVEQCRGLPPTAITVMEFDPLRDEGIAYAQQLLAAGVSVELHCYPGTFHGSAMMANAAISLREAADRRAALRKGLDLG